ncbi:Hypothetical predicted protein [Pelobates cultripes]|uniref:Uncharacterized protein n=1 Tax=Pelobates cultripes TaxID=61616 RepID=A0AAD1SJF2_PELCU|nr:Hypothetical predicted protein [Pelobates cultripes]
MASCRARWKHNPQHHPGVQKSENRNTAKMHKSTKNASKAEKLNFFVHKPQLESTGQQASDKDGDGKVEKDAPHHELETSKPPG